MQSQRISGDQPIDPSTLKQALLGLRLEDYPGPLDLAELDRSLRPSTDPASNAVDAVRPVRVRVSGCARFAAPG